MKAFTIIIIVSTLLHVSLSSFAQQKISNQSKLPAQLAKKAFYGIRLFTENDYLSFFSPNTDDNYTGGVKVEFLTNNFRFLRLGKLFKTNKWDIVSQTIGYGVTVFTPNDIANDKIVRNDRPYASYEFLNIGSYFIDTISNKNIVGYELLIGSIGSQRGRNLQTTIHKNHFLGTQRPVPMGWDYQVANGGSLAII